MGRIIFDSTGKLTSVDGEDIEKEKRDKYKYRDNLKKTEQIKKPAYLEKNERIERIGWVNEKTNYPLEKNERIERIGWTNEKPRYFLEKNERIERTVEAKNPKFIKPYRDNFIKEDLSEEEEEESIMGELRTSDSLLFLKPEKIKEKQGIQKYEYWNFYNNEKQLEPLKFSNGKTQEDVVRETVNLIKQGNKIIFLKGVCGSGKSAIALNIARHIGRTSIVVPLKSLQKQYEEDYTGKKFIIKPNGEKMKIASITGKDNHDSIIYPGISCADNSLPENIKIIEKNISQLTKFIEINPFTENVETNIKDIKRMKIAPSNPHWSPILPADFEIKNLPDAKKIKYKGTNSREYIFYHRKPGCSYYDQYLAYIHADVIIFNAAKYNAELAIGRKPETEVEIIDEADEFLDNLFDEKELNLNRLHSSLNSLKIESDKAKKAKDKILKLIESEINENISKITEEVIKLDESNIKEVLMALLKNPDLESEISLDEQNYANKALEIAKIFEESMESVYLSYRKDKENLYVGLVSSNLSGKIKEIIDKNKSLIFMSGTLHSENVIRSILGITEFKIVEAETLNLGEIDIIRTGKEFNCQYSTFSSQEYSRTDYIHITSDCIKKAKLPLLVHVNAYNDLPSEKELEETTISNIITSESLIKAQSEDKSGKDILKFRNGGTKTLFTTKCSRGIDFPGEICNSILFTKYPNPNINNTFWKILKKTHPKDFWSFYKDKAKRELMQKIYRGVRSANDHIYILSPDIRVIEAVQEMQREIYNKRK